MPLILHAHPPITGHCPCGGATTYRCTAAPLWQSHCHCESCRRATASPFTPFFGIADGAWEWTGTNRNFCPTCGTQMAYRSDKFPGECHVYAATLVAPEAYTPQTQVHTDEQTAWPHRADTLPRR
ncbi:MAG: GFA family protein [Paracoccaceae bacterium]